MRAAFISTAMPRCGAGSARAEQASRLAARAMRATGTVDGCDFRALPSGAPGRDDVAAIVAMLADDPLGAARERVEASAAAVLFHGRSRRSKADPEYPADGGGGRATARWSAACSSASCRG